MRLYNTLTGAREEFATADGKVRMYVCGITPYSASHLGHAMSSVAFDVVRRYLEFKGFEVIHVQNFTDVDDKMIQAAAENGTSMSELAEANIDAYLNEMDELGVLRAHHYPRATGEIDKIIEMIRALEEKDCAYSVGGDVYFRVSSDADYGKLSRRSLDSLMAGARVEIDESKEDVMDFALWKARKPGEPSWDSPWGPGRPGWHIECSAMSMAYLGDPVDIHGGGQDLVFPHHENEIAQSESYTDSEPFARFWLHNGLLRLGDDKMSKSQGNIISIREALAKYSGESLRLFILSSHYRSPLVYNDGAVEAQERALERLRNALALEGGADTAGTAVDAAPYRERFVEAMDDDLNTPRALAALFDLARSINRGHESGAGISGAQSELRDLAGILGLSLDAPDRGESGDAGRYVELLIEVRSALREAREYALADRIRDGLAELGVTLEDKPQGTTWRAGRP